MNTSREIALLCLAVLAIAEPARSEPPRLPPYSAVGQQTTLPSGDRVEARGALPVKTEANAVAPRAALTVEPGVVFTWLRVTGLPAGPAVVRELERTLAGEFGALLDRPVAHGDYSPMGAAWKAIEALPADAVEAHLQAWRRYLTLKKLHLDRTHNRGIGED